MTPEQAQEIYQDDLAAITAAQGTGLHEQLKIKAWRQYEANIFKANGDLSIFHTLQKLVYTNWTQAVLKYVTSQKTADDLRVYLNERVDNCSLIYESELIRVGLATDKFTYAERDDYACKSWIKEQEVGTEALLAGTPEACIPGIKMTREYFYDVHAAFVPLLSGNEDITPTSFFSEHQETVYAAPMENIYSTITPTQQEIDDYEDAKSY